MHGDGWKELLVGMGLPLGATRSPPKRFDVAGARRALAALIARGDIDQTEREALSAWLAAFRHHWPDRFADTFGPDGERALQRFRQGVDANRYLKLRRIAVENLSHVL